MIQGTVMAWSEVLQAGRSWDEARDTPRIRKAFTTMATGTRWPTPSDFFSSLPAVEQLKALPARVSDPAVAAARMAEIQQLIKGMRA